MVLRTCRKLIFYSALLSVFFSDARAVADSTGLRFDLIIRQRTEAWNGFNIQNYGDEGPDAVGGLYDRLLFQRIVAGVSYRSGGRFSAGLHIQDSRAFGWSIRQSQYPDLFKIKAPGTAEPYYIMNPGEEFLEIYDAYLQYASSDGSIVAKLGRQKISLGDYRVFGPGEWGNTGRWNWDALRVTYSAKRHRVDMVAGGTKIHDPLRLAIPFVGTEFWGGGIYGHWEPNGLFAMEPFYAAKFQGSAPYINTQQIGKHWIGTRFLKENLHRFILDGYFTYQFGNDNGRSIDAFGVFAKIGYKFASLPARPLLSLRETYASGGSTSDIRQHTFDPVFGAADKFYGWMNLVKWSNLDDREIVLELFPLKDMWIEIKNNWFFIPAPGDFTALNTMKLEPGSHYFGREFNIFVRYDIHRHWQLVGAYGHFVPGDLQPINGAPPRPAYWFALQVQFTL